MAPPANPKPTGSSGKKWWTNQNAGTAMRGWGNDVTTHQTAAVALDTFLGQSGKNKYGGSNTCLANLPTTSFGDPVCGDGLRQDGEGVRSKFK